jgi:hypothetical protein
MENAPRVLRIDSRFRVSGTSTNFTYQLPESMQFPEGTRAHVSAVSLPYSWWNVDADVNDTLYIVENTGAALVPRAIKLTAGQYTSLTLPTAIQNALNAGSLLTPMTYAVSYVSAQGCLSIQLQGSANAAARFQLPSEDELMNSAWRASYWNVNVPYNTSDPKSLGDLLRLPSASSMTTSMQTGLLDVGPQHVLYLKSNLGTFNTVGPRGERDIISRVPVDVSYGYIIHYREMGSEPDFFDISNVSFRTLTFSLTNSKGAVIDLHGGQISIEIIFDEKDPR